VRADCSLAPSLYIDPLRRQAAEEVVSLCFEDAGGAVGCRKLCCGGVFPSPGGYLRANVNDGTYVRCRSEVPVIV